MVAFAGCNDNTTTQQTVEVKPISIQEVDKPAPLYENEAINLLVTQSGDWQVDTEARSYNLEVTLHTQQLHAIISTVSTTQNFAGVKQELLSSVGDVEILSENDEQFSFQSKLKSPVRTDVFIKESKDANYHLVIVFMSPVSEYDRNQPEMKDLLNHIHFD